MPIKVNSDTKEGISTWVCGYVLFKDAPGRRGDKAYDYLNAVNDPRGRRVLVRDWGYGHANAKGMAGVDPAVLKKRAMTTSKIRRQDAVPVAGAARAQAKMIAEFEQIKAGH